MGSRQSKRLATDVGGRQRLPFAFEWLKEEWQALFLRAVEATGKTQADYARECLLAQARLDVADAGAGRPPRERTASDLPSSGLPPELDQLVDRLADALAAALKKKLAP